MTELKRTTNLSWRRHLLTEPGIEGMLYLRERTPVIVKGDADATGIIFDAGRTQGWKDCLDAIADIISVVETKEVNYENP